MDSDRSEICRIISEMLDNPDKNGIYPTTKAYDDLKEFVQSVRVKAIGWTHADDCCDLDKGMDPRDKEVPQMLQRALFDLDKKD